MTVTAPTAPPSSRRSRRKDSNGDNDLFGSLIPLNNPTAVYAYRTSIVGMIPILGLILGPVAIALGLVGCFKCRNPEIKGRHQARAAVFFGMLEFATNLGGMACIAVSQWWLA